jgi:hypothetical protein
LADFRLLAAEEPVAAELSGPTRRADHQRGNGALEHDSVKSVPAHRETIMI